MVYSRKPGTKQRVRAYNIERTYGLTIEQHQAMYLNQNGCCASCGVPVSYKKTHTDHDHNTGRVRGLLCRSCNHGLGIFGDSPTMLRRAANYVERTK